ncbi:MAG: hypothetical protein ACUVX9_06660 [Anaerolineae bacterium]
MDCPNCKTYNPEDRTVCWRCDQPLPKPVVKKKRQMSSQQWLYIIVGVMVLLMMLNMCGIRPFQPQQPVDTGALGAPRVAQVIP